MQRLSSAWNKEEKSGQRPVCRCKDNMQPHLFASFNIVFCILLNCFRHSIWLESYHLLSALFASIRKKTYFCIFNKVGFVVSFPEAQSS